MSKLGLKELLETALREKNLAELFLLTSGQNLVSGYEVLEVEDWKSQL